MGNKKIEELKDGKVIMTKLLMMKEPDYRNGFIAVFPNRDHGNRKDGLGLPSLSPMNLGPVNHVMKEFPPAKNLENYWQFSKVTNPRLANLNDIRTSGYLSDKGQRHGYFEKGANISHSEFYSSKGELRKYKYIDSRFFYCHYYEKLVNLEELRKILDNNYNIQIFGYDSFDVGNISMMEHYLDESKAFGHEAVIYCMLTIKNSTEYPWNIYKEKNQELYTDMI